MVGEVRRSVVRVHGEAREGSIKWGWKGKGKSARGS